MTQNAEWYFAKNNDGDEEGFNDSGIITFKSRPHHFVARESLQNILDAKDEKKENEPASALFRLFQAPLEEAIPQLDVYREIIIENIESNDKDPNAKRFFKEALKTLKRKNITILQISDYSTVGITDVNKKGSGYRWHNLIKRKGSSIAEGKVGGTYGIGKHATFACSGLRTVLYNTKNIIDEEAFIWKSIFSTHGNPPRRAAGYFCELNKNDGEYSANGFTDSQIFKRPSFIDRDVYGSDIFIMDFEKPSGEGRQPWNIELEYTVMNNYFLAIYENELLVRFVDEISDRRNELHSGNIKMRMERCYKQYKKLKDIQEINYPYLDTYIDNTSHKFSEKIQGLGNCELFVKIDKDFPKKVARLRSPKMLVFDDKNPNLGAGYSALFLCNNKTGNQQFSKMEDPTHSDWDPALHSNKVKAQQLKRAHNSFINKCLRELIPSTTDIAIELEIGDLYYEEDEAEIPKDIGSETKPEGDEEKSLKLSNKETAWHDIMSKKPKLKKKKKRKKLDKTELGFEPGDDENLPGSGGKTDIPVGPDPSPNPYLSGPGPDPGGHEGEKKLRKLPKSQYKYRCYNESGSDVHKLVIRTNNENICNMHFHARGLTKSKNESLIIEKASDPDSGNTYDIMSNQIIGVKTNTIPTVIELSFAENRKFSVELDLYV